MLLVVNLFLIKFYNGEFFEAMTFFKICVPLMIYFIGMLFLNLIEFVKLLHIEDPNADDEEPSIVSPKQMKLLTRVFRDMCTYFGLYYFSAELDKILVVKEDALDSIGENSRIICAVVFLELAMLIQVCIMRKKRNDILQA
jgi:hypothetical protein